MYRLALGISVVLFTLAGCSAGGPDGTTASSTVTTTTTTTAAAAEQGERVELDEVRQALQRTVASTGRLTERSDYALGPNDMAIMTATVFDGVTGDRESVRTVESDNPELVPTLTGGASAEDVELRVRYLEGVLYLNAPAGPAERRDRWLRFTAGDLAAGMEQAGITVDGDTAYPAGLLRMVHGAESTALRSAVDGGTGYRLTVPASLGGSLLTAQALTALADSGHDLGELTGTLELELVVGPQGSITSARMDVTDALVQVIGLVGGQSAGDHPEVRMVVTMDDVELGVPFTVEAPAENLVDDA